MMKTPATCPSTKAISPTSRPPKFRPNILTGARITATTITSKAQSRLPQRKRSRPKTRRNAELLKNVENWWIQLIIVIKLINLIQLLLIFFLHEKIVDRLLQFIKWNFYRGYMFIVSFNKIFFLKNVWFNIFLYNAQIFKMATPGADTEAFAFSTSLDIENVFLAYSKIISGTRIIPTSWPAQKVAGISVRPVYYCDFWPIYTYDLHERFTFAI